MTQAYLHVSTSICYRCSRKSPMSDCIIRVWYGHQWTIVSFLFDEHIIITYNSDQCILPYHRVTHLSTSVEEWLQGLKLHDSAYSKFRTDKVVSKRPVTKRPRHNGPRQYGPRQVGPVKTTPSKRPRQKVPRHYGPRHKVPRHYGPRHKVPDKNGPLTKGPRQQGPKLSSL